MSYVTDDIESVEGAWRVVADLYCRVMSHDTLPDTPEIQSELLFCLLGGFGISYELGRSAAGFIQEMNPFSGEWSEHELFEELLSALSYPRFEPRRRDGSLRRYRFPSQKASVIVRARRWVREHDPLYERLQRLPSPRDRRSLLLGCPGVGYKTASWVLRNTGLGNTLAIIDIHVLRALKEAERIPLDARIPQDYERIEGAFLNWCDELDAPPAAFDLFLWHWQRGSLRIG